MIGALIGAGLSVASSIAGNIAANKERAKARALRREQLRENQAWRDREYYADPTKRADTIRLLTQTGNLLRQRRQAAQGTQSIMGGTDDSVAAIREANNQTIADTTGNLVAANEARKDRIDSQYRQRKAQIEGQQIADHMNQANDIATTVKQVGAVAGNIANGLDSVQGNAQKAGDVNGLDPIDDVAKLSRAAQNGTGGTIADMYKKGGAKV